MSKRYHHGELRQALVDSAAKLLAERPADRIGLREVARAVGVSSAAPYRHFQSREALLTAVAAQGFDALAALLRSVDRDAARRPKDRAGAAAHLTALGQAYIAFALENRNLADLMFRQPGLDTGDPGFAAAAEAAFAPLQAAMADLCGGPARDQTVGAWALVHGLSMLAGDARLSDDLRTPERLSGLAARAIAAYARGIGAPATTGPGA